MKTKKTAKKGKKLARAKSLKKVKPLAVDYYVNLGGISGTSQPGVSPDVTTPAVNPSLSGKTIVS